MAPIIYNWFTKPDDNVLEAKERLRSSEIESYGDTKMIKTPIGSFFKNRNISTKVPSNSESFTHTIEDNK